MLPVVKFPTRAVPPRGHRRCPRLFRRNEKPLRTGFVRERAPRLGIMAGRGDSDKLGAAGTTASGSKPFGDPVTHHSASAFGRAVESVLEAPSARRWGRAMVGAA
ncbi:hypothetical protein GCM10027271_02810 [Saccharopolyspora gloriosae]